MRMAGNMAVLGRRVAVAALFVASGCAAAQKTTAPLPAGGHHVLFVGNSLTYVNDLPGTLVALAASSGDTIRAAQVAFPDYALEDHLAEGSAAKAIALGGWELVVLQQGPSSVEANRQNLIANTRLFDARIRAAGGRPALYSVWPQLTNATDFARAIESYRLAAEAVSGLFLPVGSAWLAALAREPSLQLYASDGLHPSPMGTYLAALVMYERILGRDARTLPGRAVVAGATLDIAETTVRLLQISAHEAGAQFPVRR